MEDPELVQKLSPLFQQLLEARSPREKKVRPGEGNAAADKTAPEWSVNLEWMSVDFKDIER
jgi:hypothetical protein